MRILQLFNRYVERGGEEASVGRIFDALQSRHEIVQVSFASEDWLQEPAWMKLSQPLRMFHNPGSVRMLRRVLRDFRPDLALFHNVFPVGSLSTYRVLMEERVPVVQYIHNFRPFSVNGYCWAGGELVTAGLRANFWPEIVRGSWQQSRLKTACYASVLWSGHQLGIWQSIDGWVAISNFMKETFVKAGVHADRIGVIPHSWELSVPVGTVPAPPEPGHFLFLGRMTEEKGLRVLADAWERVERARPNGRLTVAGDGPMLTWFRDRVRGMARVEVPGYVGGEKKQELTRSAMAMVVPSVWWEPLGLVAYEAFDYSRPVLAADSGGLAEIVRHGERGWLHAAGDPEMLATQMIEALDDSNECERRGLEGRSWLEATTGTEKWLHELEGMLGRVLAGNAIATRMVGRRLFR